MVLGPAEAAVLDAVLAEQGDALVALRRDLHAHPELGRAEVRTTGVVRAWLEAGGVVPRLLPGTGILADIGDTGPMIGLRADLDALPLPDVKQVPYSSQVPGVCHACGHDVHTAVLVGAGLVLARLDAAGLLPGRVRLIFQPAEEAIPGGAVEVVEAGGLDGVRRLVALHCDPRTDVGRVGVRVGALTAATSQLVVHFSGPGGHTSRPHLTVDLIAAMGAVITQLPLVLTRVLDPRAALSLVWGQLEAGYVANVVPTAGVLRGTVRTLSEDAWREAPSLVPRLIAQIVEPYGAGVEVDFRVGHPPVINDQTSTHLLAAATEAVLGPGAVVHTEQSFGGEDFAWYLQHVPGVMARLGTAGPGVPGGLDLHRGSFDVDERAIAAGVRVMVATALATLDHEVGHDVGRDAGRAPAEMPAQRRWAPAAGA